MFPAITASAPRVEEERYLALLRAVNAIASCTDCSAASETIASRLREVTTFDFLHLVAFDVETNELDFCLRNIKGETQNGPECDFPVESSPISIVHESGRTLLINNWCEEARFPEYGARLLEANIASTCAVPLQRGERGLGALVFGRFYPNAFDQDEVQFLSLVGAQVALALDAALNFCLSKRVQTQMELVLDLTNQVVSNLELKQLLRAASASVRKVMECEAAAVLLVEPDGTHLRVHALDFPEGRGFFTEGAVIPIEGTIPGSAFRSRSPVVVNRLDRAKLPPDTCEKAVQEGINSFCDVPLISKNRLLGVLAVAKREEGAFDPDDVGFLTQVANQVAIGVENALAYSEIEELKNKLAQEKLYLEDEIRGEMDFEGIVGQSSALRNVLKLVETVAPSNSTVLLLGETGTGKELIARAIHDRSRRKDRTFVKVNCAAIPSGLLESELFGHERGAFTGAIMQKIGRLELADQGTLFLDEVGDIPLEIQPKLLRALQEREFERLGSTKTMKVDVRLVAATNRNLDEMIAKGQFRSDLYYRLNVFPIRIPPLRERPEDIPLLVRYFAQKYGRRMEKTIESIPAAAMKRLTNWHWPGNIRELENLIERSVILTQGSALHVPAGDLTNGGNELQPAAGNGSGEREEILQMLKMTRGRVGGSTGAAARLGLKRTTLISRMKKLGIDPRDAA